MRDLRNTMSYNLYLMSHLGIHFSSLFIHRRSQISSTITMGRSGSWQSSLATDCWRGGRSETVGGGGPFEFRFGFVNLRALLDWIEDPLLMKIKSGRRWKSYERWESDKRCLSSAICVTADPVLHQGNCSSPRTCESCWRTCAYSRSTYRLTWSRRFSHRDGRRLRYIFYSREVMASVEEMLPHAKYVPGRTSYREIYGLW